MNKSICFATITALLLCGSHASADVWTKDNHVDLGPGKTPWVRTMTTPHDPANREETYKVFTHILDAKGEEPITKGAGGKFTQHRGLFIGWKDTLIGDKDFDTWHMENCFQRHVAWGEFKNVSGTMWQDESIEWCNMDGKPFIKESRQIGATWACCSCVVNTKRYWVLHLTHPSLGEVPVYSIRKYARFGAFWEPTLEEGKPQKYAFRVVVSEKPLDGAACQKYYDDYAKGEQPSPQKPSPMDQIAKSDQ